MFNMRNAYETILKVGDYLRDQDVDSDITLKHISKKRGARVWIGLMWLQWRAVVDTAINSRAP